MSDQENDHALIKRAKELGYFWARTDDDTFYDYVLVEPRSKCKAFPDQDIETKVRRLALDIRNILHLQPK